jgi:thiol-disulfide isomerase/thioredoxin
MKYLFLIAVIVSSLSACSSTKPIAQTGYEVSRDGDAKILKGTITRSLIENDTSFAWFKQNMQYGLADPYAVDMFKQKASQFSVLVFGGTWCHDTQNLLPKFYRLIDKSGFPENKVTLIGVDRAKTAPNGLHTKWNITNVPTFIILKNGVEVGRVVEYGKTGNIEKELGEIVAGL